MYLMFFASFQVLMLLMTEMMEIDRYVRHVRLFCFPRGCSAGQIRKSGSPPRTTELQRFSGFVRRWDVNNLMFLIDLLPKDTHLVVYIHALLCRYIYIYIYLHTLLEDIRT